MSNEVSTEEVWKAIPGFEGRYSASNFGRIKSHLKCRGTNERILKPYPTGARGDLKVDFRSTCGKTFFVSILIASAFLPPDATRNEINHEDGNFLNNRSDNLERSTRSENIQHMYNVLGKGHERPNNRGVKNHNAKLTETLVLKYRMLRQSGMGIRAITRISGLDRRTIQMMLRGVSWRHVH